MDNKMESFKAFVSKHPSLKSYVDEKKYTWQDLYEHYDLYGEDDDLFKEVKETKEEKSNEEETVNTNNEDNTATKGLGQLFDVFGSIDIDKVTEGLNSMKKILNVISEVTSVEEPPSFAKRNKSRPYTRDDD